MECVLSVPFAVALLATIRDARYRLIIANISGALKAIYRVGYQIEGVGYQIKGGLATGETIDIALFRHITPGWTPNHVTIITQVV